MMMMRLLKRRFIEGVLGSMVTACEYHTLYARVVWAVVQPVRRRCAALHGFLRHVKVSKTQSAIGNVVLIFAQGIGMSALDWKERLSSAS
jgi:hypothetical protein